VSGVNIHGPTDCEWPRMGVPGIGVTVNGGCKPKGKFGLNAGDSSGKRSPVGGKDRCGVSLCVGGKESG
jgi:hypothetical protein